MGEYLSIFNSVKEKIYNKEIEEAYSLLKSLLNRINIEYISLKPGNDKNVRYKTLNKLTPVLKDLKANNINENVIVNLMLDRNRLVEKPILKAPIKVNEPSVSIAEQVVQEPEPKKEEKPKPRKFNRPHNDLMPLMFDDYIGQEKAKENLKYSIGAAKKENRLMDHILICSPYGIGKTTLANIIGNEMGVPFFSVNASNLKDAKSVARYFSKIEESCIVFIDEIHALKKDVQTIFLSILTEFKVSFISDNGEEEVYDIPPFTLIGATTQAGELIKPLINRFQILQLVDYTDKEKALIVKSKFDKLGYEIDEDCIADIARRCRGIPRTIEIFARGIRDVAVNMNAKTITKDLINTYFEVNDIDKNGLTKNDLLILRILDNAERPLALITLESKTGIQREDLEYRYEPFLIKLGLIEKTEKGRIITKYGHDYINPVEAPVEEPDSNEENSDLDLDIDDVQKEENNKLDDTPKGDNEE